MTSVTVREFEEGPFLTMQDANQEILLSFMTDKKKIIQDFQTVVHTFVAFVKMCSLNAIIALKYVGYSESKYRLRISLAHPRDCHFTHVQ